MLCEKRDSLLRRKNALDLASSLQPPISSDRIAVADEHYRQGERYFQADLLDLAAVECQKAVETNPQHMPARALLAEIKFIASRRSSKPR